jgi:hypothetical protein
MIRSRIARAAVVMTRYRVRLVTRMTLGIGILMVVESDRHTAMHSPLVWAIVGAIGVGVIVASLPTQVYDLYLRYQRNKQPRGIDLPKQPR